MSQIDRTFQRLRDRRRKAFIPFVTAGDPDIETSKEIILALAECGADIIELGVPFTDPMADGPVIQASSMRALGIRITLPDILRMVADVRLLTETPIVLFSYLNPLYRYGMEKLADDVKLAGVDGVLVTDAVDEEASEIAEILRKRDLDLITLVAPTTSDERLRSIASGAAGFIYAVSRAGVTGVQQSTSRAAEDLVRRVRRHTELPVAVGFGISTREQVEEVWRYADAAVVGSAIVAEIERSLATGDAVRRVRSFVSRMIPPQVAKETAEI